MTGDLTRRTGVPPVVVMGVSAAGKSSVARALADRLGVRFVDADDLHPRSNLDKMASGIPLDDDDRRPWLDAVADVLTRDGRGVVVACSALRRAYRDRLRDSAPDVVFVLLSGSPELLAARAAGRTGHFMPPALLASQLATLEPLFDDEDGVTIDIDASVDTIAQAAHEWVSQRDG